MSQRILLAFLIIVAAFVGAGFNVDVASARTPFEIIDHLDESLPDQVRGLPGSQNELGMEMVLQNTPVPERDLLDLAVRLKRVSADVPRVVRAEPLPRAVGDQQLFWVSDQSALSYFKVTATLRYITPHVYMWVENGYNVSDEEIQRSAERFETHIYPLTRQFFGSEWSPGVDSDPHISIFNGYVPGVGGYYSSADEFSCLVNPYSNEQEMFYINLDNASPGQDYYDGILAHEFQHMIHWYNDRNETTWINEGLSELSAQLNGFETSGSVGAFIGCPDTQLTSWPDLPGQAAANYGAAHSFMNYLLQRFGEIFIRDIVTEKSNGLSSIDRILQSRGLGMTANDVFADWVIANYLGDPHVGPDGRFGHRLLQASFAVDAVHDAYPVERATDVHQYGTDYIELNGAGDLLLEFQAPTQVKISDNQPHSGHYQWWSNRGDDSNMMLTRAFDLTGLPSATLEFWLWHDIEREWDYAYVEVSTDGGHTWDILRGTYSTDQNPNGNSFGWAYTGLSGGGDIPGWVQERVDLTPYAGQEVLIRFEYVTDDAVNHAGLCLDDISIPELGYSDDVESDGGGWDARGFVRSNNRLPQRFLLQLIEFGPEVRVQRLGGSVAAAVAQELEEPGPSLPAETVEALAGVECQPYEVQVNDNLWNLAERFLGDGTASDVLMAATNAQHEKDASYARIDDGRVIRRGWKLCAPGNDEARQAMLSLRGQLGQVSPPPSSVVVPSEENLVVGSHRFVIRGLGRNVERAVLAVSAIAPVTTEVAPYRYTITPLSET